jgi:hypothetical protein
MGASNSEFGYISATTGRGNHEVFMDCGGIGEEEEQK